MRLWRDSKIGVGFWYNDFMEKKPEKSPLRIVHSNPDFKPDDFTPFELSIGDILDGKLTLEDPEKQAALDNFIRSFNQETNKRKRQDILKFIAELVGS